MFYQGAETKDTTSSVEDESNGYLFIYVASSESLGTIVYQTYNYFGK